MLEPDKIRNFLMKIDFVPGQEGPMASRGIRAARFGVAATVAATTLLGAQPAVADPDDPPAGCFHGLVICISQDTDTLRLVDDGAVLIRMAVRFGAQRTPTRVGTFRIEWKDKDHVSKEFGSPMPFSMFFDGGQAIHYSEDFAARGYRGASHGCVNTRDYDATKQLFESVKDGTRVIIYTTEPPKDVVTSDGQPSGPDDPADY
jgi:L,D-transpeptidase catalytic domain